MPLDGQKIIDIASLDCIYLSFDEPNAEEHWAIINSIIPWAKRVKGYKGIDTAHKVASLSSTTDRFILIDGDTLPDENFFNQQLILTPEKENCVFRWKSRNVINGLVYGNGGLSCWTKEFVLNMQTHEHSETETDAVEFCWKDNYLPMHDSWSTTYPNGSELQAFRAGFREGAKLSMNRGKRPDLMNFEKEISPVNLDRLKRWMTIGADVENGRLAMAGARLGMFLYLSYDEIFEMKWLTDVDYLTKLYNDIDLWTDTYTELSWKIHNLIGLELPDFDAQQSKFIKDIWPKHKNIDIMLTEQESLI